jgi:hypothetical protein
MALVVLMVISLCVTVLLLGYLFAQMILPALSLVP